MIAQVCVWSCLVIVVCSRVVRQPDGIISIITELEPDKTPVSYLQAVDRSHTRGTPVVHETPPPPLAEGEFRVRSAKIRLIDPETGFKVVHHEQIPDVQDAKNNSVQASAESERRNGYQAEPASDFKVVYSPTDPEYLRSYKQSRRLNKGNGRGNDFKRKRKLGKYGTQTPRRVNTVRTDKTTKIRNNDEPAEVYKQTIVRPVTQYEEVRERRKYGKAGKYGTYASQRPISNPTLGVGEVMDNSNIRSDISPVNDRDRNKSQKEYSSRTVVRFPDGYSQGNERRVESSSNYKTGGSVRDNYRPPDVRTSIKNVSRKFDGKTIPTSNDVKVEVDQPLQEAGSLLGSGVVHDGLEDDSGVIYVGGGYDGGASGYSVHGDEYEEGFDREKHFEKEKGKDYIAAHNSAHGEKGQKGYNNEEAHSKGQSEKHGHDENKGYSVEKEGDKKSHLDKSSQYAAGHQTSEGAKGSDFHKEKGHSKGHKKTGFRKVHHKDEYKKDEEFYDEEHSSGDNKQHGHTAEEHGEKYGGNDKKAYLDSGHHQASRGHEGGHEKGQGYNQQKGYHKEKGHSGHYGNEEEYGKKAGHKKGEAHGHSEYGGHGSY